jgi:hypothetical protein
MGLGLEYLYQDQVVDVSTTEADLNTIQVHGNSVIARPGVRLQVHPKAYLSADFPVNRQFYREPLDDYWETGPVLTFGVDYRHGSQFTLSYQSKSRQYETDNQVDEDGNTIPNTRRVFREQEIKIGLRHYYDSSRHWRSTLRLSYRNNQDNGSGFFDYDRYGAAHQLTYRAHGWDAHAEIGYYYYHYPVQRVDGPESPKRTRGELRIDVALEKELTRFLKIFAHYEYEAVDSNAPLEDYTVNQVTSGLTWVF